MYEKNVVDYFPSRLLSYQYIFFFRIKMKTNRIDKTINTLHIMCFIINLSLLSNKYRIFLRIRE